MSKEIKIVNGDQEGYCLEESLPAWESAGWTRADDGSSEESATPAPEKKTTPRKAP